MCEHLKRGVYVFYGDFGDRLLRILFKAPLILMTYRTLICCARYEL
jgi:hypothetical protein